MIDFIVFSQVSTTLFLCGLIWFVQVVHYPLFSRVGLQTFAQYQADHQRRTTWVVVAPMFVELAGASALVFVRPATTSVWVAIFGLSLVVAIWLSTFVLQVPRHRVLEAGFNARQHRQLVWSNWVRTIAWSLRAVLVLYVLFKSTQQAG